MSLKKSPKKSKNNKIGIFGYGEVGQAIVKFYESPRLQKGLGWQVKIKDLNKDDNLNGVDILHICIPWSERFNDTVREEIKKIRPKLTIIHSSIAPGTTKKIALSLPKELAGTIVHSPVRGIHPHLYEGIKTFVKYIGADNKKAGDLAKKHLEELGIKTKVFVPSVTTEVLKLWDTAQYGWMIVLNKEIKNWCDERGLDFEAIYTEANKSYNEGYRKLGRPEVVRPYLRFMPGEIGGHCVISNCYLLDSEIAKFILEKNHLYGHEK